jgi:molybdate transport system ATP-binding protein
VAGAIVRLDAHLQVQRGDFALDAELTAEAGEVVAVVGPNGAGKTTILRTIAGDLALDAGRLVLGGRVLDDPAGRTWLPPEQRRIGVVHQDLLLFPHLRAVDDVAFGLRCRGIPRREARRTAMGWLERFDVGHRADARPAGLSGGQAQRVALARALAPEPNLLLLDEPLAALDAGTRPQTRRDLRRWLATYEGPTLLVTHDPVDALLLADRVLVLEDGRVSQAGTLHEVTTRPRTPYVAELMGTNLLQGRAGGTTVAVEGGAALHVGEEVTGEVFATVAPTAVSLHRTEPEGSARNRWPMTVREVDAAGSRVRVALDGAVPLVAEVTPAAVAELDLQPGSRCWASVKATEISVYAA